MRSKIARPIDEGKQQLLQYTRTCIMSTCTMTVRVSDVFCFGYHYYCAVRGNVYVPYIAYASCSVLVFAYK